MVFIVNASYLFTQFSTLAKSYTITAREPSIYPLTQPQVANQQQKKGYLKKVTENERFPPPPLPSLSSTVFLNFFALKNRLHDINF